MRHRIVTGAGVALLLLAKAGYGLTVTGQVVDSRARPVEGAEVVVCEQHRASVAHDPETRLLAPIATTDAGGRFQVEAKVPEPYGGVLVARKPGYAYAWDVLNDSSAARDKGEFLLVLEPACTLTGRVVDANDRPVAGARVQAVPVTSYLRRLEQKPIVGPTEWFATTTDAEGVFRFAPFAADVAVTFRVQAPGRESLICFRTCRLSACGFEVWRTNIRLQLPGAGAINGCVQDSQGRPVADVELLLSTSADESRVIECATRTTRSDGQGRFAFAGVPPDSYDIDLLDPEQGPNAWIAARTSVSVAPGRTTEGTIVHVEEGGILRVTALAEPSRQPVTEARISVYAEKWHLTRPAFTDAQGRARVRVPARACHVYLSAPGFARCSGDVEVTRGQTLEHEALLDPVPRVSGRVLDSANQPAAGAVVMVHPWGDQVTTDNQGRFEAGCEELGTTPGGFVLAQEVRRGLAGVVALQGVSQPVTVKLGAPWTLTGRIADPNGRGVPVARVALSLAGERWLSSTGVEVLTDPEGRFTLAPVPPVAEGLSYRLSVAAAGYGVREYARISPAGAPGTSVDLGVTELPRANASLSGVVVDAGGTPAPRIPIFVNRIAGGRQPSKTTATNEKGEFTIMRLCPERVRLQANFSSAPGGEGTVETAAPARDLKIVLGKLLTQMPQTSLQGKPLPHVADLGLSAVQVRDKPLLVCFCDLEQRPSRQCLTRLAQQSGNLETQGVILWVVQVSRVDMAKYEGWLKDNAITMPLHRVAGDFQAQQAAWGVQSLPWLVLTDAAHTIQAEGFGADEVQNKIKGLPSPQR